MKEGVAHIVGKRIAGVVVARSPRGPKQQVFLVFDDGTRFEFWGENFSCCAGLDKAHGLVDYVEMAGGDIVRLYGGLVNRAPTLEELDKPGAEIAIRTPWTTPPWKPSRTRQLCSLIFAMRAIDKARGK